MGAENRRDDAQRMGLLQTAVDAELFELVGQGEPVAALRFDRRHAELRHVPQKRAGPVVELVLGGRTGLADRVQDAPALLGDLLVARSVQPHRKLLGSPAREGEVGVTVDETGNDEAPLCVVRRGIIVFRRQIGRRSYPLDRVVRPDERRVLGPPQVRRAGVCRRRRRGDEGGDVSENWHRSSRRLL